MAKKVVQLKKKDLKKEFEKKLSKVAKPKKAVIPVVELKGKESKLFGVLYDLKRKLDETKKELIVQEQQSLEIAKKYFKKILKEANNFSSIRFRTKEGKEVLYTFKDKEYEVGDEFGLRKVLGEDYNDFVETKREFHLKEDKILELYELLGDKFFDFFDLEEKTVLKKGAYKQLMRQGIEISIPHR